METAPHLMKSGLRRIRANHIQKFMLLVIFFFGHRCFPRQLNFHLAAVAGNTDDWLLAIPAGCPPPDGAGLLAFYKKREDSRIRRPVYLASSAAAFFWNGKVPVFLSHYPIRFLDRPICCCVHTYRSLSPGKCRSVIRGIGAPMTE